MTEAYLNYLNSSEWMIRRTKRLHIGKNRCAACGSTSDLHVHHLTYDRLYNERMEDLLPLCRICHNAAENLISIGKLSRIGDPVKLGVLTIRALNPIQDPKNKPVALRTLKPRNDVQENLLCDPWFLNAINLPRNQFKRLLNQRFSKRNNKLRANAFTLYDRNHSIEKRNARFIRREERLIYTGHLPNTS